MYLSRVEINPYNRKAVVDLNHVGAFHGWIESSFHEEIKVGLRTRKLWRIDEINNKKYLLLLSESKPDLDNLEKYGIKGSAKTKDYLNFLDSLKINQEMRFKIILNPVESNNLGPNKRGTTKLLTEEEEQLNYLKKRDLKNGFKIVEDSLFISKKESVKYQKDKLKKISFIKITYEVLLTIFDLEKFKSMLVNGMGKHKAYGFGLFTAIPTGRYHE